MKTSFEFKHSIVESIKKRKSLRAFDARPIEPAKINSLFEAARWAPSSANEQPWVYIYATKEQAELWQKMFETLNDGNKLWAKDAPLLILSLARKTFTRNGQTNGFAHFDLGAANSYLALQAAELGLHLRQMGGYSQTKAKEALNISDEYMLGSLIAVGYPGESESLPEVLREREKAPRERMRQSEFALNKSF